jgi:SPP1 family predicted phage head-tail adaptor
MFDSKIEILKQQTTKNSLGEESIAWVNHKYAWANVNYKGGREGFYARQVVATGDVVFKIRYDSTILETMKIVYNNRNYDIRHIAENGRMNTLEITATMHDND